MENSIHGILLINKSVGCTSHHVVHKISKIVGKKIKVGHAGTLDPFADGLLIVCIGEATKLSNYLMEGKKAYLAELKLGVATDTLDKDGAVVASDEKLCERNLSLDNFVEASKKFIGKIKQKIPKYSAAKIDGKKGYEYAREGVDIDMPEKEVEIFDIHLKNLSQNILAFETTCGSGTFIRQLGSDLAESQNTCGHLITLKRTMSCGFSVSDAFDFNNIDKLTATGILENLVSFNEVATKLAPFIVISDEHLPFIKNANKRVREENLESFENGKYFLISKQGEIISLVEKTSEEVKTLRGFVF